MEYDDDDDFYAPEEPTTQPVPQPDKGKGKVVELEEGEEEEDAKMKEDIDTHAASDHNDTSKLEVTVVQQKYSDIRNIPARSGTGEVVQSTQSQTLAAKPTAPAESSRPININPNPIYKPLGKPLMSINIDEDLADNEKPWRQPGIDLTDYFNYGFDEFSWTLYADKQSKLRADYRQETMAERTKKMMEDMNNMLMMPNIAAPIGGMPGMDTMTPEMQAMMQQMMATGMDPTQMDPTTMAAMFSGMQDPSAAGGGAVAAAQGNAQAQNFGGNQAFGANQAQAYGGFDQNLGMNHGGFGGGGRGGRGRRW